MRVPYVTPYELHGIWICINQSISWIYMLSLHVKLSHGLSRVSFASPVLGWVASSPSCSLEAAQEPD